MNFRTIWSYLRFQEKMDHGFILPQTVIEACLGKDPGSKLLTENEGEVLELLIAAEQGVIYVDSDIDLYKQINGYFNQIVDENNISNRCELFSMVDLIFLLKSLEKKGYIYFKPEFFVKSNHLETFL